MGGIIPIIFAVLLIFFVISYDWKSTKLKSWMPYVFVVLLFFYILHNFLVIFGINIFTMMKDEEIMKTLLQKLQE